MNQLERMLFAEYDATRATPRRRVPVADMRNEDQILPLHSRETLVTSARDARRNYAIAAWAIRKHLDFVSDFQFRPNTPNEAFNQQLLKLMTRWQTKENCHLAKRHPLRRLMRQIEGSRTVDGDVFIEKLRNYTLRIIRGDRVRSPNGLDSHGWIQGCRVHPGTEEILAFNVHNRTPSGWFKPLKVLPAANCIHHGYFDESEQIRGVSPLSSAINNLRDTYEGIDFALARLKVEQIIGYAITNVKPTEQGNPFAGNRQFLEDVDPENTESENEAAWQAAEEEESRKGLVDYGQGVYQIELRDGEDIKNIGGNMPSSNAQAFLQCCIHIALKSLDIPYSFYSEDFTNYYGSRGALQLYKRSAKSKQADNAELLDDVTTWLTRGFIIDGKLQLPRGWKLEEIDWAWIPTGVPPWDRSKEITGDIKAIAAGLDSPQNICLENSGNTFEENVLAIQKAAQFWQEKLGPYGLPIGFMQVPGQAAYQTQQTQQKKAD